MRPKDLKRPFTWDEREVRIDGGILFIPDFLPDYTALPFPGWPALFGNTQPIHLEYCSGNGSWIAERAAKHKELNWIGVEKRFDRVQKMWSKRHNLGLDNFFIVCGMAESVTRHFFAADEVAAIYVNFPDPWPKKRHAKHRLIQRPFIDEMGKILSRKGSVTLVTDDPVYSEQMIEEMQGAGFLSLFESPHYITDCEDYGDSFFDALWREKGKTIRYHEFQRGVNGIHI